MILIVADTGPLNYLIQIGCVDLLSELVETAVLPDSVLRELKSENAPFKVREWAENLPTWVEVRAAGSMMTLKPELSYADCEAISLAKELNALLLMDDRRARRAATDQSVRTLGTLGLLEAASAKGLIQLSVAVESLRATNMFISDELIAQALRRDSDRRGV